MGCGAFLSLSRWVVAGISHGVPHQSCWTVHDVALAPLTALDELAGVLVSVVEATVPCVLWATWVVVNTVVTPAFFCKHNGLIELLICRFHYTAKLIQSLVTHPLSW